MRLYVIGPVSGVEGGNRAEFEAARSALEAAGHSASIPHDFIEPGTDWQTAMRVSIARMVLTGPAELDPETGGSRTARAARSTGWPSCRARCARGARGASAGYASRSGYRTGRSRSGSRTRPRRRHRGEHSGAVILRKLSQGAVLRGGPRP